MQVLFHKNFDKKYRKLSKKLQLQTKERIFLFSEGSSDPQLHNHPLRGEYAGYFSINITGDYRAIYLPVNNETVKFIDVDTHAKLYNK